MTDTSVLDSSQDWEFLGEEIRMARHREGMTQDELAEASGLTKRTVGNYERGRTPSSAPRVPAGYLAIARVLGWNRSDVLLALAGEKARAADAQPFGSYIADAARRSGYDIDSPRGGGKTALAQATGMSLASVSRMLSGQSMPDPSFLERLAAALRIPLAEMLVRAGIVSPGSLEASAVVPPPRPLTIDEVAAELGIIDPERVVLFKTMVEALQGASG